MGKVNGCGYHGQHKDSIYDMCRTIPSTHKEVFWLILTD